MRSLLAVVLIAGLLGACDQPSTRTLRTEIPANPGADEGTVDLKAIGVRLRDYTGLAVGIEAAPADGVGGPPWIEAEPVPGRPHALRIDWMGGMCTAAVQVLLWADAEGYWLQLHEESTLGGLGGCPAAGVHRSVVISLAEPLAPAAIRLQYELG